MQKQASPVSIVIAIIVLVVILVGIWYFVGPGKKGTGTPQTLPMPGQAPAGVLPSPGATAPGTVTPPPSGG